MDIISLPKTREINGYQCSLHVLYDSPGWLVTYMYYEHDPLGMNFYPTLQDSIDALCERLDIKPEPITEEWLESNGYHHENHKNIIHEWRSEDGRISLNKYSNTIGRDWNVHIDNEDFQSIGGLDIQETWQLESILRLAGIKR